MVEVGISRYCPNIHARTALGEAQAERWEEVLLNQGEIHIMVSITHHRGLHPPLCSPSGPRTRSMQVWCPTPPSSAPPDPLLKTFYTMLELRDIPTYGQLLSLGGGGGLEAHLGLAMEDIRDDVFNPPTARPLGASMSTNV